ncbi:MAG: hypothetical protein NPIRA05_01520 [Nitrospirales bacterium]|nr:MAG: hypothetical protein NPIRA05_01520 [Nitrospirales bacterium]
MSHYIDGFVHPIPNARLEDYKSLVKTVAEIWKEHGALAYWESTGNDMLLEGTRSFVDMIDAKEDETVLFGWVVFESREARDLANVKVANDPRMEELMSATDTGFDGGRMAYGGFKPFVSS